VTRDDPKPSPDDLLEGTSYRLVKALAQGGTGGVYLAEHIHLGTPVVVKLLLPGVSARPDMVERLEVEGRILARLDHPNLVRVRDFGVTRRGKPFLVMEHLRGRTFGEELRLRGVLSLVEALDYASQALAGLEAAHRAGVVHRDVKLGNLFLCNADDAGRRKAKVLDFGIAKVLDATAAGGAAVQFPTAEGTILGTPGFISPEQVTGAKVDARTDVYGIAVVLYRLLCGRGPFVYDDFMAMVQAHVYEMPLPPSRYAPQPIPREVDRAVLRALAKQPEDRPASAATFAGQLDALRAALAGEDTHAPSRPPLEEPAVQPPEEVTMEMGGEATRQDPPGAVGIEPNHERAWFASEPTADGLEGGEAEPVEPAAFAAPLVARRGDGSTLLSATPSSASGNVAVFVLLTLVSAISFVVLFVLAARVLR
jgi:eukaryotic-like serine/threonine-protein kinase